VKPNYLGTVMAERQSGSALVSQAVFGAGANNIGGHLDVVHLNSFYLKATAFLQLVGFPCVLGKCMLFSARDFDQVGGLFAVRNYLAEDLVAGEMMKEAGYKVSVTPDLLRQTTVMSSFKAYWNRHVRWARLRKCHFFTAYLLEPLLFESIWPVALWLVAPDATLRWSALGCFSLQMFSNEILYQRKFCDADSARSLKWFWLKDMVAPLIWIAGLSRNTVVWRGQHLTLRFGENWEVAT